MDGFSFLVNPMASLDAYLNGARSKSPIENIIRNHVKPNDITLDIGANLGWTTRLMSHLVGEKGQVHAFEPMPVAFENLSINAGDAPLNNIKVYPIAVSNCTEEIELFFEHGDTSALSTMRQPEAGAKVHRHRVSALRLDDMIQELGKPAFIKIDVEGAEYKVLEGMLNIIRNYRPKIAIELTDSWLRQLGSSAQQLLDLLTAPDYTAFNDALADGPAMRVAPTHQVDLICVPNP